MSDPLGLEVLKLSFFGVESGSWWVLYESFTGWSTTRKYHPWVVTFASARTSFYHGMPRSSRGRPPSVSHDRHARGHEPMCYLDYNGWIVISDVRPLRTEWFAKPNWYSCTEPEESDLLHRIDDARRRSG